MCVSSEDAVSVRLPSPSVDGSDEMASTSVLERGATVRRRPASIGSVLSMSVALRAADPRRSLHLPP